MVDLFGFISITTLRFFNFCKYFLTVVSSEKLAGMSKNVKKLNRLATYVEGATTTHLSKRYYVQLDFKA